MHTWTRFIILFDDNYFWRDVSNYFHRETWGKSVVGAEVTEVDSITEDWWGMVK